MVYQSLIQTVLNALYCSEVHAYPCIRLFHFVNLMMSTNPIYPTVIEAGKSGDTLFLDIGCNSNFFYFLYM